MKEKIRYVGLDVHSKSVSIAVADTRSEVLSIGTFPNDWSILKKALLKLGTTKSLRVCYEAGPCGYTLYWNMVKLGIECVVVAPTLIPIKSGDRVKTDRRDAEKLARFHRAGELTAVWVPDANHEALRDLVRLREDVLGDRLRARHRLSKFLLRQGKQNPQDMKSWSSKHRIWIHGIVMTHSIHKAVLQESIHEVDRLDERISRIESEMDKAILLMPEEIREVITALQSLRGVAKLTATTIVSEVGKLSRFESPRQLMAYAGVVPRESSSGGKTQRGGITKTGNAHLRRVLGEAAWSYRQKPNIGYPLKKRQEAVSPEIRAISYKAQHRLHGKFIHLLAKGKPQQKVVTAVARELLGFIWAIGKKAEQGQLRVHKKIF